MRHRGSALTGVETNTPRRGRLCPETDVVPDTFLERDAVCVQVNQVVVDRSIDDRDPGGTMTRSARLKPII